MPLSLRCATALFGHFGIEWDLTEADDDDLAELAAWIRLYKRHRALIHAGRMVRIDTPDDTSWMYGVVAADASIALMCYVQLDEPVNDQPTALLVPGLDPLRRYRTTDVTPRHAAAPPGRPDRATHRRHRGCRGRAGRYRPGDPGPMRPDGAGNADRDDLS